LRDHLESHDEADKDSSFSDMPLDEAVPIQYFPDEMVADEMKRSLSVGRSEEIQQRMEGLYLTDSVFIKDDKNIAIGEEIRKFETYEN
jgi:hypothetical protein